MWKSCGQLGECALVGCHAVASQLVSHLSEAWRPLSTSRRNELPNRATPMLPEIVQCIAGLAAAQEPFDVAFGLLVCFHCVLRSSEIRNLKITDLSFGEGQCSAFGRDERRKGAPETDKALSHVLERHCEEEAKGTDIFYTCLQMHSGVTSRIFSTPSAFVMLLHSVRRE